MNVAERIESATPAAGEIALVWLGQNGFVVKNSAGEVLVVDPYLSDLAERLDSNRRLTLPVLDPAELRADVVAATHVHTDHLDLDSLPALLRPETRLVCCTQSAQACAEAGLPLDQVVAMSVGDVCAVKGFEVEAVFADHGDLAPAALGFVVTTDGVSLYFAGDGAYQPERMRKATDRELDILVSPINGEYGNMSARDAAMLAAQAQPRLAVPSHFWTFARHRGNPFDFEAAMPLLAPGVAFHTMAHGELLYYSRGRGHRPG